MLIQQIVEQPHLIQHVSDAYFSAVGALPANADNNPFSGLKPKWTLLGEEFDSRFGKLFQAAWALAIAGAGFMFLAGLWSYMQHKGGNHPQQLSEATADMKKAGIGLVGVLMVGTILAVVIKLAG